MKFVEPLIPITIPPDWDAEKDCEYVEKNLYSADPASSYTTALWDAMRFHYGEFVHTLNASLAYFCRHDARLTRIEPSCLTAAETIAALIEVAKTSNLVASCRERLLEVLAACEFTEAERHRILKAYRLAGDHAWMYPVIELLDWIGYSNCLLDQTMLQNDDYRELNEIAPGEDDL
jgi:hypothetical protein